MPASESYEQTELYQLMTQTQFDAVKFAGERLEHASVLVNIESCDYPFKDIPNEIQAGFNAIGYPAERVIRMDMELAYDRGEMLFAPQFVQVTLENTMRLAFSRIRGVGGHLPTIESARTNVFYPQVLSAGGQSLVSPEKTRLVPADILYEFLGHIGVGIPTAPQRADWSAIESTLQFSDRWTAIATDKVPIDAMTSLYVEERTDGRGHTGDEEIDDDVDRTSSSKVKEVILALDRAQHPGGAPSETVKYIFLSDEVELPRFAGMLAMPLSYESEILGQPATIRVEHTDAQTMLLPTVSSLNRLRSAIASASE